MLHAVDNTLITQLEAMNTEDYMLQLPHCELYGMHIEVILEHN